MTYVLFTKGGGCHGMRGIKDWNLFMSFPVLVRHHDKELSYSWTLKRCLIMYVCVVFFRTDSDSFFAYVIYVL